MVRTKIKKYEMKIPHSILEDEVILMNPCGRRVTSSDDYPFFSKLEELVEELLHTTWDQTFTMVNSQIIIATDDEKCKNIAAKYGYCTS